MAAEQTKPKKSSAPPRTLNVQKFAESRASELVALHSIVKCRLDNDFRSQRNKRRRTTGHDNRLSRKRYRKKQKVGEAEGSTNGLLVKDEKKLPRRVRRRIELKKNPQSGFSAAGDGTKRLRTHVWHAKRFTITKLWGFCLPVGLHGRGKGSRAILKKSKQGVLVHDASYCSVVQLDGPEDILLSILSSVLVPFPSVNCDEASQNVLSGVTYGSAMLHHVGSLNSESIAPVTYMWRSQQSNFVSKIGKIENCDGQHRVDRCSLLRQLWLWMHPAAFREGYGVLESACEKMKMDGHSVSSISLEGELAKLELIGPKAFWLIQKILHPITSVSMNSWTLPKIPVVGTDGETQSKDTSCFPNEDEISASAINSLVVKDPRIFAGKTVVSEPTSSEVLGAKRSETEGNTYDRIEVQKKEHLSSSFLIPEECCQVSDFIDLWDVHRGILPPIEESFLCKEKYRQSLKFFGIAHQNLGSVDASGEKPSSQFSHICPLMLLKDNLCNSFTRWSIILPLSWVKVFWNAIVSNGAQAIGLRERHWVAGEAGLPYFPSDFPDTKAYSCFMQMEEAINDQEAKLKPPALRPLRVPAFPHWEQIQCGSQIKSVLARHSKVLPVTDHSMANLYYDAATLSCGGAHFNGCIARTSYMLNHSFSHLNGDNILLFPKLADGKKCFPMIIKDEEMVKQSKVNCVCSELECSQRLCFVRVRLRAYKEGVFREGAVVCAPHAIDITSLTTRTGDECGMCQIPESLLGSCFDQHAPQILGLQLPEDAAGGESIRPAIGFVTTGFVQGSKKPTATALCEAAWLAHLRDDQCKTASKHRRRKDIYVLVRNLRSTAYRLALATIVLEEQEGDLEYM